MSKNYGGCICESIRYETKTNPIRVTFCHCKFCQRGTGSAYLVEPIFERTDFDIIEGVTKVYRHRSEGSGKIVEINFCENCGTKLFLGFERFPDVVGVFGGTFDDPNWFEKSPKNSKHIFLEVAQHGTIIPAGFPTFKEHATLNDGSPVKPNCFEQPHIIK